jgi:ABC-type nitrate/sulfonate/bicarbonate transport system permease component
VTATLETSSITPKVAQRRARGPLQRRVTPAGLRLLGLLAVFFLVWETASRTGVVNELFASRPSDVALGIPELFGNARVRDAVAATAYAMFMAFVYGTGVGILLGYALGFSKLLRTAFYGPALFLLSVPKSIFIPVFMALFGINQRTTIYYAAFSSFIYVLINVVGGFDLIEARHLRVAQAYNAGLRHRILEVILPASLPGVFTAIWYGLKSSLQGVLIIELFISVGGLGALITFYANDLRVDLVFGLVLLMSVTAIFVGSLWSRVERSLSRWRPRSDVAAVTSGA